MEEKQKLYIAILYHQHQPYYKDPITNYYHMPWVRLHAIKDYYDMPLWTEKFTKLKLNFNLVPSLMIQIEDYAFNNAIDKHLELTLKPAEHLTLEEKIFILENFFNCNWETMIFPFRRFAELLEKRGKYVSKEELKRKPRYFSVQDFTDLQMWSNLVWFDPLLRNTDLEIKSWFEKEKNFSYEDIVKMVKKQREICSRIIKKHKELQDENKIEVSVTPFYHPILPLLCDYTKAKISNPGIVLPKMSYFYEDAKTQVKNAISFYEQRFGKKPKGMWPSEGSVSMDIIPILAEEGIQWIATDEEILKNSLLQDKTFVKNGSEIDKKFFYKHYEIYHPVRSKVNIIFRDRTISDNIGFVYNRWSEKDAVKDIETRLLSIYETVYRNNNSVNSPYLVSIILDGENCWEYYKNDGTEFLYEFYSMVTSHSLFEPVLISEFIEKYPPEYSLTTLWPGSWINANYNIWIGHPEDNLAWEYLTKTREFLCEFISSHPETDKNKLSLCWEEIYAAEGSDWFWWYGDEHYTAYDYLFDFLFRQHLKNVYVLLDQPVPKFLETPIKLLFKKQEIFHPIDFISPVIDGNITSYFEWLNAGKYSSRKMAAMHQSSPAIISGIYFGFDLENFYLRIDCNTTISQEELKTFLFEINIIINEEKNYKISYKYFETEYLLSGDTEEKKLNFVHSDKIVELKLPFKEIETTPEDKIKFSVTVLKQVQDKKLELEHWPAVETIHPDETYPQKFWSTI